MSSLHRPKLQVGRPIPCPELAWWAQGMALLRPRGAPPFSCTEPLSCLSREGGRTSNPPASPATAFRILEFPPGFNRLFFLLRVGGSFLHKTLGDGGSTVMG